MPDDPIRALASRDKPSLKRILNEVEPAAPFVPGKGSGEGGPRGGSMPKKVDPVRAMYERAKGH